MAESSAPTAIWRTLWRWHFYAGLLVIPFVIVLSLSGALYLFKPQVERWEERAFHNLPTAGAVAPSAQVAAALAAHPGTRLAFYRLPERAGDAAMVHLALPGHRMRDVFVSPQGRVLGALDPETRVIAWDRRLHGQLLFDRSGSILVELLASWTIVLILSGLALWWPRGGGPAGVVWPRLGRRGRPLWRDLHAVTGFWVSALALVLLFTGLPWAQSWGSAFKLARGELGLMQGPQDWTIGGKPADGDDLHAEHNHAAMAAGMAGMDHAMPATPFPARDAATLDVMAALAARANLAFPAEVVPPGMPSGEGGSGKPASGWVIKSDAQNRPLRVTIRYDAGGTHRLSREDFADRHWIDRVIGYGVAWHEGQLFGWINQLIGVFTAAALVLVAVSGFVLWRRRKPAGGLGAPPGSGTWPKGWGFRLTLLALMVWLPLFTASLLVVMLLEAAVLRHIPAARNWLGLSRA
ncbi:MAG: PepSY domain-containing protein [Sphingomonadales bacterium]|nr:PepSY domain-containing protein [Sphingomonadales bacterium]